MKNHKKHMAAIPKEKKNLNCQKVGPYNTLLFVFFSLILGVQHFCPCVRV